MYAHKKHNKLANRFICERISILQTPLLYCLKIFPLLRFSKNGPASGTFLISKFHLSQVCIRKGGVCCFLLVYYNLHVIFMFF